MNARFCTVGAVLAVLSMTSGCDDGGEPVAGSPDTTTVADASGDGGVTDVGVTPDAPVADQNTPDPGPPDTTVPPPAACTPGQAEVCVVASFGGTEHSYPDDWSTGINEQGTLIASFGATGSFRLITPVLEGPVALDCSQASVQILETGVGYHNANEAQGSCSVTITRTDERLAGTATGVFDTGLDFSVSFDLPNVASTDNTLTWEADGVAVSADNVQFLELFQPGDNPQFADGVANITGGGFSIQFPMVTGTLDCNDPVLGVMFKLQLSAGGVMYRTPGGTCSIEVTAFEGVGGTVSGTFTATDVPIPPPFSGDPLTTLSGAFSITRP